MQFDEQTNNYTLSTDKVFYANQGKLGIAEEHWYCIKLWTRWALQE